MTEGSYPILFFQNAVRHAKSRTVRFTHTFLGSQSPSDVLHNSLMQSQLWSSLIMHQILALRICFPLLDRSFGSLF